MKKIRKLDAKRASSRHYSDFKIGDGNGNIDGRQGIRLNWDDVSVLEVFQHTLNQEKPSVKQRRKRATFSIWYSDRSDFTDILAKFPGECQADKVSAWIQWSKTHKQQEEASQAESASEEPTEELSPDPKSSTAEEPQHSTHQKTTPEIVIDTLIEERENVQAGPQLTQKIDELIDVMRSFVELQMKSESRAPQPHTQTPPKENSPQKTPQTRKLKEQTEHTKILISLVIDAIIAYNNQPQLNHRLKWEITTGILKHFFTNQYAIQQILTARNDEITAHHQLHSISHGHNNYHRRLRTITDVIKVHSDGTVTFVNQSLG